MAGSSSAEYESGYRSNSVSDPQDTSSESCSGSGEVRLGSALRSVHFIGVLARFVRLVSLEYRYIFKVAIQWGSQGTVAGVVLTGTFHNSVL